jgi:hypothetical protein
MDADDNAQAHGLVLAAMSGDGGQFVLWTFHVISFFSPSAADQRLEQI